MNKQEILDEIASLKEQLNNLEKLYDSFNPPNKRWRAEKDDKYYFISTGGSINYDIENVVVLDDLRYVLGNYFKTAEEAEFEIERLKVIAELKEWATPISEFNWDNSSNERKYTLEIKGTGENIHLTLGFYYHSSIQTSDLCFQSEEVAKSAIESVGEERIIKYYFRRGENNGDSN